MLIQGRVILPFCECIKCIYRYINIRNCTLGTIVYTGILDSKVDTKVDSF